jgi:hypothetical protein
MTYRRPYAALADAVRGRATVVRADPGPPSFREYWDDENT